MTAVGADFYDYKQTGLHKLCDTKDSFIQEVLTYSAYGYKSPCGTKVMTPTQCWAQMVLKDTFYRDEDEFDCRSWNLLDDMEQPYTVQANHRGDGKTTRSGALISRMICFRMTNMLLYLQATYEDAATEMDNVKSELLQNSAITEIFGIMKAQTFEDVKKTFGKRAWFACDPKSGEPFFFVLPRGAGQRVRGRNIYIQGKRVRPKFIVADDLEDDLKVLDEENRVKLRNWWQGSVMPLVPQDKFPDAVSKRWIRTREEKEDPLWFPPYRVLFNGTVLHHDALLMNLMSSSQWKAVCTPLGKAEEVDGKVIYTTLRPSRISSEQLTQQAEDAKKGRYLDTFYREKLCIPTARENACWTADMYKYYTHLEDKQIQNDREVIRFVIVDPSKSASQQSDLTGIIAVAVNPRKNAIYIRRAVAEHLKSADVPKRALEVAVQTNSQMVFVEIIGQHGVTDENFTNAVTKRGLPIQLFWLTQGHTPKGDYGTGNDAIKRWRAQQILPYYQDGEVWHHPDLRDSPYEMHQKDYPNPTDWCFLDCSGYIPAAMNEIGVVFSRIKKYDNIERFQLPETSFDVDDYIHSGEWAAI